MTEVLAASFSIAGALFLVIPKKFAFILLSIGSILWGLYAKDTHNYSLQLQSAVFLFLNIGAWLNWDWKGKGK